MQTYYNTNLESGAELAESIARARAQEDAVLWFFIRHADGKFTREEVNWLTLPDAPYTSVQRAITNLTERGLLEKLGRSDMVRASTGKQVHRWRLAAD